MAWVGNTHRFWIVVALFIGLLPFIFTASTPTVVHSQSGNSVTRIESDDARVEQSGMWTLQSTSEASGGSYLYSSGSTDDALTLEFDGTSVEILYVEHAAFGTFAIDIDNTIRRTVVTTNDTTTFDNRAVVDYLENGHHTLRVYAVEGAIAIDAFMTTPFNSESTSPEDTNRQAVTSGNTSYMVFERHADGSITPVYHRYVDLHTPLQSLNETTIDALLNTPNRNEGNFKLTVSTPEAGVVYRNITTLPTWVRGEFHADGLDLDVPSEIDGHYFSLDSSFFVTRVPATANGILTVEAVSENSGLTESQNRSVSFELDVLATDPTLPLAGYEPESLNLGQNNRDEIAEATDNRVDLLVMGEGYTAAQSGQFTTDATAVMNDFFTITPYNEYRGYVNVHQLALTSAESGADHPPYSPTCDPGSDPSAPTCCLEDEDDPFDGTFVDTAIDATFCGWQTHRLLVVNTSKALAAAAAVPEWDQILVIVNDTVYGGSGGTNMGVFSIHPSAVSIAQHEYGHSFTSLADEYDTAYPGFPACSDTNVSPTDDCERNTTNQTVRASIRWNRWIDGTTPIPTIPDTGYNNVIGLFEGARYLATGMYRPGNTCLMRYLNTPFCNVASEAYPMRLYEGGWGTPASGIDIIEPGTESHVPNTTINVVNSVTISAQVFGPTGANMLVSEWYVNSNLEQTGTHSSGETVSFEFNAPSAGEYTVILKVIDDSAVLHYTIRETYASTRTWTVSATNSTPLGLIAPLGTITNLSTLPPAFEWNEAANTTWYRFYLSNTSGLVLDKWYQKGNSIMSCNGTTCSLTPDLTVGNDNYTWYVQGWGINGYTQWTSAGNFAISIPAPNAVNKTTPADAATLTDTNVTFTWDHDPNATWYQLWVSGTATWYHAATSCTATCSVTQSLNNSSYIWYVQAYGPGGLGSWGAGFTFTVAVPPPSVINKTAPLGTISSATPTFEWQHDTLAAWYQVWIGTASTTLYSQWHAASTICNATDCSLNTGLTFIGDYTWYIRGWNVGGYGDWGTAATFNYTFTLIAPSGTVSGVNLTYQWDDLGTPTTWYHLWIGVSGGSTVLDQWIQASTICNGTTCSFPTSNTLLAGNYIWYVQPYGSYGYGAWTAGPPFNVSP